MTHTARPGLTNIEFKELRDVIYRKCGMFYPLSRKHYIEKKVINRMAALRYHRFNEYLDILEKEPQQHEIIDLINEITVNETFFFRDRPQLEVLETHVFPEALSQGKKCLNILSAGCSSGEEPYTVAIILREKFPLLSFNIIGVDISDWALTRACRGEYTEYAVRFVPREYLKKYFIPAGNGNYKFLDRYKTDVRFQKLNLMELDTFLLPVPFDVILCRYVLIYFDKESKQKLIDSFYDKVAANGYLILGNSESLFPVSYQFKMLHFPSAVIYTREKE